MAEVNRSQIEQAAERLHRQFEGKLNAATVERFLNDSVKELQETAEITSWVTVIAERHARDRLRAIVRIESVTPLNPSVLFVCGRNAGRSQIAAGWMRHLAGATVDVFTAGSRPAHEINQTAIAAMAEKEIDISASVPKPWSEEVIETADVVVTMGCDDTFPVVAGKKYFDWDVEDPEGKPIDEVRLIRDDIEQRVRLLMVELEIPAPV